MSTQVPSFLNGGVIPGGWKLLHQTRDGRSLYQELLEHMSFLLSLANRRDMARGRTVGAQHAAPSFQSHCILQASAVKVEPVG